MAHSAWSGHELLRVWANMQHSSQVNDRLLLAPATQNIVQIYSTTVHKRHVELTTAVSWSQA